MDNKEFDDIIKKKLESLSTNGNEGAWDLFKEKWENSTEEGEPEDTIEQENQELDEKIKKDMQNLRIPFNSQHWIKLKEQLELEALFKKRLFVAKSVELLILAFLVLGVLTVWPIQKNIYQLPTHDIPMVSSVPVTKASAEKFAAQEEQKAAERKQLLESSANVVSRALIKLNILPPASSNQNAVERKNVNSKNSDLKSLSPVQSIHSSPLKFPFIDIDTRINKNNIDHDGIDELNSVLKPMAILEEKEVEAINIPIRPIGFPDISLNRSGSMNSEKTYLSFAIGPKVNLINSPFDPVYGFDPYNTINTNFNITAKIGKKFGSLELFTGLGYTNTSYVPRVVDEIYEPRESQFNVASLENINFKTFSIPVGVKYNFIDSRKVELYVAGGVDLNIIADSEYIIQDIPLGRSQPGAPAAPPSRNTVNENAKLSQKEFNKGILSGGSLKDNLYATASIGLGMNLNVSSHTGIFVEPRYSHFISPIGIGPNEDRLHGLSIDLGVRYQLN